MENECEALPGVAYPGVRDNRSTINTKTGYDDDSVRNILILIVVRTSHGVAHGRGKVAAYAAKPQAIASPRL